MVFCWRTCETNIMNVTRSRLDFPQSLVANCKRYMTFNMHKGKCAGQEQISTHMREIVPFSHLGLNRSTRMSALTFTAMDTKVNIQRSVRRAKKNNP